MKTLITSAGYIIYSADSFSFGPWEEADTLNGVTVHKWKAEDSNGNLLGYTIDENMAAIDGSTEPTCQIVEIESYPEDYVAGKYLYVDGAFVLNPDYVAPPMSTEEMESEIHNMQTTITAQTETIATLNDTVLMLVMGSSLSI